MEVQEAHLRWIDFFNKTESSCLHVLRNQPCKSGLLCPNGSRKQPYYVVTGCIVSIWVKLDGILQDHNGMRMRVIRLKFNGVWIVGILIPLSCVEPVAKMLTEASFLTAKVFKCKFAAEKLRSDPPNHARVRILHLASPSELYLQIEDQELNLYHQMLEDLHLFCTSTDAKPISYPPLFGHSYALWNGTSCHRVLIEKNDRENTCVFHVDTGLRHDVGFNMDFYDLPQKYFDLPAQAMKSRLEGVFPPGSTTWNHIQTYTYPADNRQFLDFYYQKTAFAFFAEKRFQTGEVGRIERDGLQEITSYVILYEDQADRSINHTISRREINLARLMQGGKPIESPTHSVIRKEFLSNKNFPNFGELEAKSSKGNPIVLAWMPSSTKFYFRSADMQLQQEHLLNEMHNHFVVNAAGSSPETIAFDVGFVCAVYVQGRWSRAQVVSFKDALQVRVYLLDCDYDCDVHTRDIRSLPQYLSELSNSLMVLFLDGNISADGIEFIVERLWGAEQIFYQVVGSPAQGSPNEHPAKLAYNYDQGHSIATSDCLAEELIDLGFTTKFTMKIAGCHLPLKCYRSIKLPPVDARFTAKVSGSFGQNIFIQNTENVDQLSAMELQLKARYSGSSLSKEEFFMQRVPGDLCVARYSFNPESWCRGVLHEIKASTNLIIFFPDHGMFKEVVKTVVHFDCVSPETPIFAIRCSYPTLKIDENKSQKIYEAASGDDFQASVKVTGVPLQVDLFSVKPNSSKEFGTILKMRKLAVTLRK